METFDIWTGLMNINSVHAIETLCAYICRRAVVTLSSGDRGSSDFDARTRRISGATGPTVTSHLSLSTGFPQAANSRVSPIREIGLANSESSSIIERTGTWDYRRPSRNISIVEVHSITER
ncbi:uncharacterized protein LOC143187679 [Calliopsis andreniformis]|uniref:uncharacterized protein LOC143187679 n=1 Tax=Calliopsis andreniformis TaxID=337506 RepID=UPI003FCE1268